MKCKKCKSSEFFIAERSLKENSWTCRQCGAIYVRKFVPVDMNSATLVDYRMYDLDKMYDDGRDFLFTAIDDNGIINVFQCKSWDTENAELLDDFPPENSNARLPGW